MSTRGPKPKVSDSEIVAAVSETDYPFAVAQDVADAVELSRERARQRLNRLSDQGEIQREKVNGIVLYWLESDGPES